MAGSDPARRWLVVSVLAPPRGEEILLVDALRRLGAQTVEPEGERVLAWMPEPASVAALIRGVEAVVRANTTLADPGIAWRWEPHAAWAERWTRTMVPRRVSRRIVVAPADTAADTPADTPGGHDRGRVADGGSASAAPVPDPAVSPGQIVIRLDPATAFGTAEHPSTRACLRFLEGLVGAGDRVADVGTGSGILAIAAARLGAGRVLALEADADACRTARTNVALNGVADRVEVRHLRVTAGAPGLAGRFRGVAANLEAAALRPLIPALVSALEEDGWLLLAGLLRPERGEVVSAAVSAGLTLRDEAVERGWWAGWLG
jgi:ribosomal protein L11 methyltransferase